MYMLIMALLAYWLKKIIQQQLTTEIYKQNVLPLFISETIVIDLAILISTLTLAV